MNDIPLSTLFIALTVLIVCSAFFSGSETGLMALNRYRLRHHAKAGHVGALRASKLLERPDRLIGLILLGNNFVNTLASSLGTVIALRIHSDETSIAVAALVMTLVLLIFGEVAPKTVAALHPQRVAYPASWVLVPLFRLLYPLVWLVNGLVSLLLKPFGVSNVDPSQHSLSAEELRTVVMEAGVMIPKRHQTMLLSILDLEEITVDDIMVPRNDVESIDLEDDWAAITARLAQSPFTRLLVYRGDIDHVVGFLHLRQVASLMIQKPAFSCEDLQSLIREPYFIPEGTPLTTQLLNFQQQRRRYGLVVDEYGDLKGLVTLEDILEEIVGEFTTSPLALARKIIPQSDGSYRVDASTSIRALNRTLNWRLPTTGPKTLNGLIMEYLENIPEPGTKLVLDDHPVEIVKIAGNRIKTVLIYPRSTAATKPDDTA